MITLQYELKTKNGMGKIRTYQSISELNDEFGVKTLHPLINVVDMSTAPQVDIRGAHCYDFYCCEARI